MEMGRYRVLKSSLSLEGIKMVLLMCSGAMCVDQSVSSLTAGSIQPTVMSKSFMMLIRIAMTAPLAMLC